MSDKKDEQKGSFWLSLPGCITAFGGLITAMVGSYVALVVAGVIPAPFAPTATLPPPISVTLPTSVLEASSPVIPTSSDPVAFSPTILPTATFVPTPTFIPSTQVPPTAIPPTQAPPTAIPPTLEPSVGSQAWRQQLEPLRDGTITSVLIVGKFRRQSDLVGISLDDQRNILIVELGGRTNQSGGYYQSLDNDTLAGAGALLVFARAAKIRTDQQIKTITDDDLRNIFIVEIYARTLRTDLQGLSNIELVRLALSLQW